VLSQAIWERDYLPFNQLRRQQASDNAMARFEPGYPVFITSDDPTFMIFRRHWIALVIAGACCVGAGASAQDAPPPSSGSGGSSSGATSSFGPSSSTTSPFSSGASTTSPFGSLFDTPTPAAPAGTFGSPGTAPSGTGTPGASSAFGGAAPFGASRSAPEAAPTFSIPGAYGRSAQSFTLGEGRLARPRFEYSATMQLGYDDNVLQTPNDGVPEVTQDVLVDPGSPPETILVPQFETRIRIINGVPTPTQVFVGNVPVTKPGRDPTVETQVVAPAQEPVGSFLSRTSLGAEFTFASRRTVFTMDLRGNADFYFDRPNDSNDLTGSVSFSYLHKITPRMQFTTSGTASYLSQPDLSIVNGPTRNVGDYFSAYLRSNLSYQWTRRFSTVGSFSLNTVLYSVEAQKPGNYFEGILGAEARYAWNRRLTLLGETRFGQVSYPENDVLNSNTVYLLLGAEYILSKRLTTTIRIGESMRTFTNAENGEGASMAPYMEATMNWRLSKAGALNFFSRFGFEESSSAATETLGLRAGVNYIQAFSARLRGNAGIAYSNRNSTFTSTNTDFTEQSVDVNLGLQYTLSQRFALTASYTYTQTLSDNASNDYYRNRIFFGGEYTF
jgi:hypothetical protein